ncbi:GlxA family transcriptional regulator [Catellatospora citrea]|uniref:Putative transcription regulator, AraC family protein n=1 Tax=Catellatospora citrea TaxID=53366 RepID=A0A8J3KIL1_9ACTN|nr:helix-turn-helix domain-containing protein [Catellatospora citrea]RKE08662.1 AraC family transcriptional regulator with amidase-like domain [Catellatospora citrea]GIG01490.1 putative transcription regulator, AraC family protein [Catellatospora citrea]
MSLYRVAVLGLDDVAPFELGVLCEVFGTDRSADGFPTYEFAVCSPDGGPIRTRSGFSVVPHADLAPLASADLVAVPAHPLTSAVPPVAVEALVAAAERGAWILSVCSGAFLLGQAGLLDGRRCTTHWKHAALLAQRHPTALVSADELYVQDGRVITSAGTAAGIDACLHLVRQEQGAAVATKLARRMVVPPHRAGGQSQFIEAPIAAEVDCDTLQPLLEWLLTHLDEQLTVEDLAARTHMAPRTFARRFRAETGATPHDWLTHQRLLLARRLLEETELTVESVATRAGFGDSATLRHHFHRRVGTTPATYRQTFRTR